MTDIIPFHHRKRRHCAGGNKKLAAGFLNQAQTGTLKIVKTADDDKIEGRKFLVIGTAYAGGGYEQEFQTDEKGRNQRHPPGCIFVTAGRNSVRTNRTGRCRALRPYFYYTGGID